MSLRYRNGYIPTPTFHGTCPKCGKPTVTRNGMTTHSIAGRGTRWTGTLAELATCHPDDITTEGNAS